MESSWAAPGRLWSALVWLLCGSWAVRIGLGAVLEQSWGGLRAVLDGLGPVLGRSWGHLGPSRDNFEPSWGHLGTKNFLDLFGYLRPKKSVNRLRPLGSFQASFGVQTGFSFGSLWDIF